MVIYLTLLDILPSRITPEIQADTTQAVFTGRVFSDAAPLFGFRPQATSGVLQEKRMRFWLGVLEQF